MSKTEWAARASAVALATLFTAGALLTGCTGKSSEDKDTKPATTSSGTNAPVGGSAAGQTEAPRAAAPTRAPASPN